MKQRLLLVLNNSVKICYPKQWIILCLFNIWISGCSHKSSLVQDRQGENFPTFIRETIQTRNAATDILNNSSQQNLQFIQPSLVLSPGDKVRISIPEGDEFSGIFEINLDGTLNIAHLPPLQAAGLLIRQLEERLTNLLVQKQIFRTDFIQTSVKPLQWAEIRVTVAGAIFQPGQVLINKRPTLSQPPIQESGDNPPNRYLSAALKAAGGVRPDANLCCLSLIPYGSVILKAVFRIQF